MNTIIRLAEEGKLPDWLIMLGIKLICYERLWTEASSTIEEELEKIKSYSFKLSKMALAVNTEKANEQHYEVPAEFYTYTLGRHLKYSSGLFDNVSTLDEAERQMLELTCSRAQLSEGQDILELGCGWGSLTLFMAERYKSAKITAISNSNSQREYIETAAKTRGLNNISVITCDINNFKSTKLFDRVISVEMFEHLKNYELLFSNIRKMLKTNGKLFTHIFCHKKYAYEYETSGSTNWLGKYFFTGGQMPSEHLFYQFQKDLVVDETWRVSGKSYSLTARHWRFNLEKNRAAILKLFQKFYTTSESNIWTNRWKIFFMACEVLFGFRGGNEWFVSHYLFSPRAKSDIN